MDNVEQWHYGVDAIGEYRELVDENGEVTGDKEYRLNDLYVKKGNYVVQVDPTKRIKKQMPSFIRVFSVNTLPMIVANELSTYDCGVLFKLMHLVDWESNTLVHPDTKQIMNTKEIADYLHIKREQLDKSIKTLAEKGLIDIHSDGKYTTRTYTLNAQIVLRGRRLKDASTQKPFDNYNFKPNTKIDYN